MRNILKLRPARDDDQPFLRRLRGAADEDRLGMRYWRGEDGEKLKQSILDLQFRGQEAHNAVLRANWETRENVIEADGQPIGRFIVCGGSEELHITDIALLREWRGKGIGTAVVAATQEECRKSGRVLRLHVEKTNPDLGFYAARGFYAIELLPLHLHLEWSPKGPDAGHLYSFSTPLQAK